MSFSPLFLYERIQTNPTWVHVEEYVVVTKSNVTIYLNAELANLAREMGLNLSKTCENALKQAINRLQWKYPETNGDQQRFGSKNDLVDEAGFEPATSTMPTWRSCQTDLPAQSIWLLKVTPPRLISVS